MFRITLLLGLLISAFPLHAQEINLFNGRDLTGWAGLTSIWSVKEGAITGIVDPEQMPAHVGSTFLVWQGGEVKDFELNFLYKLTPQNPKGVANSGVEFRASSTNPGNYGLKGFQADLDPGTLDLGRSSETITINGSLVMDTGGARRLAEVGQKTIVRSMKQIEVMGRLTTNTPYRNLSRKEEWNRCRIVAAGSSFQIYINGQQTVDVTDQSYHLDAGLIGLQAVLHTKQRSMVQFKELKLKRLQELAVEAPVTIPAVRPDAPTKPEVTPGVIRTAGNQQRIDVLKEQAPNAVEWALAPLDRAAPEDIRQSLTFLREDLLDEKSQSPKASPEAYALGVRLCEAVLAVFEERGQAQVKVGFRAVEANARIGVTSQALEARRNYKMSWPQFAREESQRTELKSQAFNNAAVVAERPKVEWANRAALLRRTLDPLYAQFRAALRQAPASK